MIKRRVYFSFHYSRDLWRVNTVRNSWITPNRGAGGVWDASAWEVARREGDKSIKSIINEELMNTSVTVVFIGAKTCDRKWVKYEIIESHKRGNGLLGVHINGLLDKNGLNDQRGNNPFDLIYFEQDGRKIYFSQIYQTYDWIYNHGYQNFASWIELAAKTVGRPLPIKGEPKTIKKRQSPFDRTAVEVTHDWQTPLEWEIPVKTFSRALRVFLCYATSDKPAVLELYHRLRADNVEPWLDKEKLLPGQDWQLEIRKAIRASDVVIVCLSHDSINRTGFVQKEIKFALDIADEQPDGTIYLIPVRLGECNIPERLRRWQWVDIFDESGYNRLMSSLKVRAHTLGISFHRLHNLEAG